MGLDGDSEKEIPRDLNHLTVEGGVHASKHIHPCNGVDLVKTWAGMNRGSEPFSIGAAGLKIWNEDRCAQRNVCEYVIACRSILPDEVCQSKQDLSIDTGLVAFS